MTPARPLASVVALGLAGVLITPAPPATAAPAPCERAERYAAQSGAELLRLRKLDLSPLRSLGNGDRPSSRNGGRPSSGGADRSPSGSGDRLLSRTGTGGSRPGQTTAAGTAAASDTAAASSGAAAPGRAAAGGGATPGGDASGERNDDSRDGRDQAPAIADSTVNAATSGDQVTRDVAVAEAKSALVGVATPSAAAVTRMLSSSGDSEPTEPLIQQAPPTNPEPSNRRTSPAEVGPILVDRGTLTAHAQWEPGMACGTTAGKVTIAEATLGQALIASGDDASLVAVPDKGRSRSTTELRHYAEGALTFSSATVETKAIELLGATVHVKVLRSPKLATSMSTKDGGEVEYQPAVVEVSGEGVHTAKLSTPGDSVELTLDGEDGKPAESAVMAGLRSGLPRFGGLSGATALRLPTVPGLPSLGASEPESVQVAGPGTKLSITIGDVRQATSGHVIAARASAIKIALTQGGPTDKTKQGYDGSNPGVVLDLEVGVLESAAVAPEPSGGAGAGVQGASAGLPVTGPRVDLLALGGAGLLVIGTAALVFGTRRRRVQR